jgi:glycosyltransferase involved in cell wall biosynthesis
MILIIMGRYLPGYKDGGPVQSIKNLTDRLGDEYDFAILTTDRDHGDTEGYKCIKYGEWNRTGKAKVRYVEPGGFNDKIITDLSAQADMLYICGCFNDYARTVMRLHRKGMIDKPIAIAPMGLFAPGALHTGRLKYLKKKAYITICKALGYFDGLTWSVTSPDEEKQVKDIIGQNARCVMAQDLPKCVDIKRDAGAASGAGDSALMSKTPGELRIIYLSRISPEKNTEYALDIVRNLKGNITFDIYGMSGNEEYFDACMKKINDMPDNIKCGYMGPVRPEDVVETFGRYHVFLFPTLGENYGHAIYESMAAGCIPVISDRTPWKDLKTDNIGKILTLDDLKADTDTMQQLVDMDDRAYTDAEKKVLEYVYSYQKKIDDSGYRKIFAPKVLFLTNIPSPYRVDFFNELGKYTDLTVLYELRSASDRNEEWNRDGNERNYEEIYLPSVMRFTSSAFCPEVSKYLKKGRYHQIIVGGYSTPTGMYAIQLLKNRKIKYILNSDGGFAGTGENRIKYAVKKHFISGADAYLSSGALSDKYLTYYGADSIRIFRYPFSSMKNCDISKKIPDDHEKAELRNKLCLTGDKLIIAVGSFIHRKGFDILIEAAHILKEKYNTEYDIYIVGGECTPEYSNAVEKYGLKKIHFLPFMKDNEIHAYYRAADLFVLPTREDIWGLVINEAMAAGLPVITTEKCGAGIELIPDKRFIIPTEDADALAASISELMEDDTMRKKVAWRNLERIQQYSIENMARVHAEILREMLKG